jgi:hypothetical protein
MSWMGKDLPKTIKWPCEAIDQKFHMKSLVLGILPLLSTFWINSRISTKTPSTHSRLVQKLTFITFQ